MLRIETFPVYVSCYNAQQLQWQSSMCSIWSCGYNCLLLEKLSQTSLIRIQMRHGPTEDARQAFYFYHSHVSQARSPFRKSCIDSL